MELVMIHDSQSYSVDQITMMLNQSNKIFKSLDKLNNIS